MEIKEYVRLRKNEIKEELLNYEVSPKLIIIQLNEDEASNAYVKGKIKDLSFVGARYEHILLPTSTKEEELLEIIDKYNKDNDVDAILVQMPLPRHINEDHIKEAIIPKKDIDGFHPMSKLNPCTPQGIINYLKKEEVEFTGKNAVVIGRSNIVGKPLAKMLLALNCNVTVLHSKTKPKDMAFYLKHADIVCVAVGRKYFIEAQELKEDAVVVDVGINRIDGILYGDCAPNLKVKLQTPVPGGVGLLTRLTLLDNLLICYELNRM